MKKKLVFYFVGLLFLLILLLNILLPKKDIVQEVQIVREKASENLDSLNSYEKKQFQFSKYIKQLIDSNKLHEADSIVAVNLKRDPLNDEFLTYKGQIYEAQHMYGSALKEYTLALSRNAYPSSLEKRAALFIKLNQFPRAIQDYRTAYSINSSYSYPLANTYALAKQKDSAIKYYNIYLANYPGDSVRILSKIKSLKK